MEYFIRSGAGPGALRSAVKKAVGFGGMNRDRPSIDFQDRVDFGTVTPDRF